MQENIIVQGQFVQGGAIVAKGQIAVVGTTRPDAHKDAGHTDMTIKALVQGNTNEVLTSAGPNADPVWVSLSATTGVINVSSANVSNLVITGNSTNVVIDTALTSSDIDINNYQADILANGTIVLANANSNFNNTATVNVSVTANGSGQVNIALSANGTALGIPAVNATFGTINTTIGTLVTSISVAYGQANSQGTYANGAIVVANVANINFNNTTTVNVAITANGNQTNVALSANGTVLGIPAINVALGTMNTATGVAYGQANSAYAQANLAYTAANSAANTVAVFANGTIVLADSNINFNNTATINVGITANGTIQTNAAFSVNLSAISGAVSANDGLILAKANINFNNTASINVAAVANGTFESNIAFSINTTMNLVSLNVSGNIANTGNLAVSQNTVTGNLTIVQNTTTGNLVISTLANTVTLNVSQNTVTGNLTISQNTTGGNASFANVNVSATINTAANLVAGNISTPQNTSTGNLTVTMNTLTGNLSVTTLANTVTLNVSTQIFAANATVNGISFIPVWTNITANSGTAPNNFSGTNTGFDTAGFWKDPFGIVHLRGVIANGTGNVQTANVVGFARNIANGFPAPTAQVAIELTVANTVAGVGGNVQTGAFRLFTNGALQCFNVMPFGAAANISNISLYGMTYSTI